jgi:hypothetical protein
VLSLSTGFEVVSMILTETNDDAIWHEIADPTNVGHRVELINNAPFYLMMRESKIDDAEMFARPPQQSDYHAIAWERPRQIATELSFLKRPLLQRIVERFLP